MAEGRQDTCPGCGADFSQGIPTPGAARAAHLCPNGGPCPCGHKPQFCHRANAARWCPPDPTLQALERERDAAIANYVATNNAYARKAREHENELARAEAAEQRLARVRGEIEEVEKRLREEAKPWLDDHSRDDPKGTGVCHMCFPQATVDESLEILNRLLALLDNGEGR